MSEEEKKSIEHLERFMERIRTEKYLPEAEIALDTSIEDVLYLIEKQQKEIEELKKEKFDTVYIQATENYKDKIREKIKKEEKHQETTKKLFPDSLNYHMQKYAVEVLKELLEE